MENLFSRRTLCQAAGTVVAGVVAPAIHRHSENAAPAPATAPEPVAVHGPAASPVKPAAKAAAAVGGLAPHVVSVWHFGWSGPLPWTGYPAQVRSRVNHVVLAVAQSTQAGTGRLFYYNRFGANLATAIKAARAAGASVVMGIGGSDDGGITITNASQADEAYDSVVGFVREYGINGIDLDLEPSGGTWSEEGLVRLCKRLKSTYGPKFIVGITPGLYSEHTARWLGLARALGTNYDYMAPMLYDFPEANLPNYPAVCVDKCDVMAGGGVPASKMMLGFMVENAPNHTANWQLTQDAYRACLAKYPALRGAFVFHDGIMANRNWDWVLGLGTRIRAATA